MNIFILLSLSACCCRPPPVGGPCEYKYVSGTAVITRLKPVTDSLCQHQATAVYFRFVPDHPVKDQSSAYYLNRELRLEVSSEDVFSLSWLNKKGIVSGSKHPVAFSVIQTGTCTPFSFIFKDIGNEDLVSMKQSCHGYKEYH